MTCDDNKAQPSHRGWELGVVSGGVVDDEYITMVAMIGDGLWAMVYRVVRIIGVGVGLDGCGQAAEGVPWYVVRI